MTSLSVQFTATQRVQNPLYLNSQVQPGLFDHDLCLDLDSRELRHHQTLVLSQPDLELMYFGPALPVAVSYRMCHHGCDPLVKIPVAAP